MIGVNSSIGSVPKMPNGRHILSGNIITYLKNGQKHRLNGPAEIWPDGTKIWFQNGLKHRIGGPAVVKPEGRKEYWEKGELIKRED